MDVTLDDLKTHRYQGSPNRLAFHSPNQVHIGGYLHFKGVTFRVKDIIREQQSHYFRKHFYYEVKVC